MPRKHAVFLRGHQRVWMQTHAHIFDKIHAMLDGDIDWYVAFWRSKTTNYDKILKTFEGKSLIHLELIDQDTIPIPKYERFYRDEITQVLKPSTTSTNEFHSHWNVAFLDQVLVAKKCEYELNTGITYNNVLFTRPDVGFLLNNNKPVVIKDFECLGQHECYFIRDHSVCIHDLFFLCNSITADVIASRFLSTFITNPTKQFVTPSPGAYLAQYFQNNHLLLNFCIGVTPFIVRPTTLHHLSNNDYTKEDHAEWNRWNSCDHETRMKIFKDLDIDPAEYA